MACVKLTSNVGFCFYSRAGLEYVSTRPNLDHEHPRMLGLWKGWAAVQVNLKGTEFGSIALDQRHNDGRHHWFWKIIMEKYQNISKSEEFFFFFPDFFKKKICRL